MQLSRIYSNMSQLFEIIEFNFGDQAHVMNVILGEVRRPTDKRRDSHNLGKTTLLHLIDFLMLRSVNADFFLVKHSNRFSNFVFFLEIALNSGDFVTIRRGAAAHNEISLLKHSESGKNFVSVPDEKWDHVGLSLLEARTLLDAWLNLGVLGSYDYRKAITYFLRSQGDWQDELQLQKFSQGRDVYWKPFVAHLFGLNASAVQRKYELDDQIQQLKSKLDEQQSEVQFKEDQLPALTAEISALRHQVEVLESELDAFRFDAEERRIVESLVGSVEREISEINNELYDIRYDVKQIETALSHKDKFDLATVEEVFRETELHFPGQLKKQYEELVAFNKKVTQERNSALRSRKKALETRQGTLQLRKQELDATREQQLKIIRSADTFEKFKGLQRDLTRQKAELVYREEQQKKLETVAETARAVRELERERGRVVDEIRAVVNRPSPIYSRFQSIFNDYCQRVLNHEGRFYFHVNSSNNLDYSISLSLRGQSGIPSSQSDGTSYKKLVCALFDLALLRVYEDAPFFHFVYHDGVLEALDNRKKDALLDVIREQIANNKTQYIMTLISADLPRNAREKAIHFRDEEVVLRLHDEGDEGRLFKMAEF
jgi:uncharacterized protein YydD (DUF2326 family)